MDGPQERLEAAVIKNLQKPFPQTLTFYVERANTAAPPLQRKLWFSTEKTWFTVLPEGAAASITATVEQKPITQAFWLASSSKLGYWRMETPSVTISSQEVSVSSSFATPAQTQENSSPPTGRPTLDKPSEVPSATPAPEIPVSSAPSPTGSSSATNSTVTTVPPQNNGISGGAVAGVAIACLVAGALIAALLTWFCTKRRKPAGAARDSEAIAVALMHREKGPIAKAVSVSSGSPIVSALENGLPQPLEDKAISGEISKISNLIKNHVQSYYHTRAVSPGIIDYDDLQALGDNLPVSVGTLSTLLNNSATREIALRFCIAWVVTSRIQLNDSPSTTFLPPEVSKCIHTMLHLDQSSRVHALLYPKWRALTAELLQATYVRHAFSSGDSRIRNVQAAATVLDSVLRPYADSRMDDGARSRNLEEIIKRSAQFAFTLFSQPSSWDFDWVSEQSFKSGSLCIFPALVQVGDENGEPINPPRPFSEAVVRRLDE